MLNKGLASKDPAGRSTRITGDSSGSDLARRPASAPAVLDPKALIELQRLDPTGANGFLNRVLATFQRSAGGLAATLVEARRTGDHKNIRLVVHTFKSSSAHIGASTLGALASRIEALIVENSNADVSVELDALTVALDLTLAAVRQRLASTAA